MRLCHAIAHLRPLKTITLFVAVAFVQYLIQCVVIFVMTKPISRTALQRREVELHGRRDVRTVDEHHADAFI